MPLDLPNRTTVVSTAPRCSWMCRVWLWLVQAALPTLPPVVDLAAHRESRRPSWNTPLSHAARSATVKHVIHLAIVVVLIVDLRGREGEGDY